MSITKMAWEYVTRIFSVATPLLVCMLGSSLWMGFVNEGYGLFGALIAGGMFGWAIILAESRAETRAKAATGERFIAALTSGLDTEIRVTFYDSRETASRRLDAALREEG